MTELKEGPAEQAYHQLFRELNSQVDAAGNRSLAKVLEKHPFPIYEASVRRFRMIKERLSEDVQQSRGTDVQELAVKVGGAVGEVVVAGFDLVWDVATAPLHLTLYPGMRHPLYKTMLINLATSQAKIMRPLGVNNRNDGEDVINYTHSMAETFSPEGKLPPPPDSITQQSEAISQPFQEGIPPAPMVSPKPELEKNSTDHLNLPKTPDAEHKSEATKTVPPDVVKVGDSERRTPEEKRATGMVGATMEFLGDLGKANLAAKKELGEMASTRIGKAIAVGAVGGGLEWLSGQALGLALDKLLVLLPPRNHDDMSKVKDFFNHPLVREILGDAGVYAMYAKGNALIGNELPKVPVSYLGAAVGVNAVDWAVREKFHSHKPLKDEVKEVFDLGPDGKTELKTSSLKRVPLPDATTVAGGRSKKGMFDFIPRTAGKLADYSNPVTLYGTAQVVEGVSAYMRAVREIRQTRKIGGETKVEMLLAQAKKAKPVGEKRDKQERLLEAYLKAGENN